MDYLDYYDLESYLLNTVRDRFQEQGRLNAFDFFSIVIWKANRAKTHVAKRLLGHGQGFKDLESAVTDLTEGLARQPTSKERFRYLWGDWGFQLPMASAILTILYPDDFTIYDYRVCNALDDFHNLINRSKFDDVWSGYEALCRRVKEATPNGLSLRDKDRYLWGKSAHEQLLADIVLKFGIEGPNSAG
jgi:hypothetical protein